MSLISSTTSSSLSIFLYPVSALGFWCMGLEHFPSVMLWAFLRLHSSKVLATHMALGCYFHTYSTVPFYSSDMGIVLVLLASSGFGLVSCGYGRKIVTGTHQILYGRCHAVATIHIPGYIFVQLLVHILELAGLTCAYAEYSTSHDFGFYGELLACHAVSRIFSVSQLTALGIDPRPFGGRGDTFWSSIVIVQRTELW